MLMAAPFPLSAIIEAIASALPALVSSHDPVMVNALANHASIRPFVGGDTAVPLDLTAAVADPDNVWLLGDHGGFGCIWSAPGVYEVHTMVLPSGRGAWAFGAVSSMQRHMTRAGASMLWTKIAPDAVHVRAFAQRCGFKLVGSRATDLGAGPVPYQTFIWSPPCQ